MVRRHVGSVVGRRKSILGRNCLRFTPPWTSCTTCTTIRVWPFSILFTVCSHWAATWSTKTYTTTTAVDFLMLVAVTMSVMPWWWLVTAVMATWAWCCSHRNRKCLLAWDARDLYKSMQPCVMFSSIFNFLFFRILWKEYEKLWKWYLRLIFYSDDTISLRSSVWRKKVSNMNI